VPICIIAAGVGWLIVHSPVATTERCPALD
jgi:hypothetical protein